MTDVMDAMDAMDEPADPLADFHAANRRRRRIGVAIAAGVIVILTGAWLWRRSTGLPPLDPEAKQSVDEAMNHLDALPHEHHAMLAAQAMAELETDRLPPAMLEAFAGVGSVPPEMVGLVAMRPFASDEASLRAWTVACPAGAKAIADVAASGDVNAMFALCQLGRWSLIDGTAAQRLSAGRLILAHAAWGWLVDHHAETELERRVLRVFVQG